MSSVVPGGMIATGSSVLVALAILLPVPAFARHHHHRHSAGATSQGKVNSVAYPNASGAMPAASDKGKPVVPVHDPSANPGPPSKAGTEVAPDKTGTPSVAYPGAPKSGPAASDGGQPIKP